LKQASNGSCGFCGYVPHGMEKKVHGRDT